MFEHTAEQVREKVETVYRLESRRILATLIRLLGDFDLAEDALHDLGEIDLGALDRQPPAQPRAREIEQIVERTKSSEYGVRSHRHGGREGRAGWRHAGHSRRASGYFRFDGDDAPECRAPWPLPWPACRTHRRASSHGSPASFGSAPAQSSCSICRS